jgi:protein-S-isoprenylcysteine O-methyltransferase Ste14
MSGDDTRQCASMARPGRPGRGDGPSVVRRGRDPYVNGRRGCTFRSSSGVEQKVSTTGPYAVVRHPMYASASLYLLGTPLALGSYWGFLVVAVMMPFLIVDEERVLAWELPGYTEYQQRARHRLVPLVW